MKKLTAILLLLALLLPGLALATEQKPIIQTASMPDGMAGIHYGLRITADGERPMLYHQVGGEGSAGTLPPGLKLSESGILSGTPTAAGSYTFSVRVTNPAGSTFQEYTINISPYDESRLNPGGEDSAIIGERQDSLVGVANAMNGGRITMQGDTYYFVDAKGFLYSLSAPFSKKPEKMFSARAYKALDSEPDTLYYYQRYLDNEATKQLGTNTYVTRIAQDPIVGKGRNTFVSLTWEDFSDLSLTNEILLYIGYDNVMGRVMLENRAERDLRYYYAGREVKAQHAIPFNGQVFFTEPGSGNLFVGWLDGELATPIVTEKVSSFTIARIGGNLRLVYADDENNVFHTDLHGGDKQALNFKASALNANEEYLFYADAGNKHRLTMADGNGLDSRTVLTQQGVDQIYTFQNSVAYQRRNSKDLWQLTLGTEEKEIRIIK